MCLPLPGPRTVPWASRRPRPDRFPVRVSLDSLFGGDVYNHINMNELLRRLVESNIKKAAWIKSAPADPARCLLVERVSPHGPAGLAGVHDGDLVSAIDGYPGFECGLHMQISSKAPTRYDFFNQSRQETLALEVSGIDIGVDFKAAVPAILKRFDPSKPDSEDLIELWQAREWQALERLALAAVGEETTGGFLGMFAKTKPKSFNHPAYLFLGAARFERGQHKEGLEIVMEYHTKYESYWTLNYAAVCAYYRAKAALLRGQDDPAIRLLSEAFEMDSSLTPIADGLEKLTGVRPQEVKSWPGQRFPVSYDLPALEEASRAQHRLEDTLQGLLDHQLLIVCLLATYRGNGPYNDFMHRYRHIARYLGEFLPMLHVVTGNPERPAERTHWFRGEDLCRHDGIPFHVLLEGRNEVVRVLEPRGAPMLYLLDRDGTVRYEGFLTSTELWDTLGRSG